MEEENLVTMVSSCPFKIRKDSEIKKRQGVNPDRKKCSEIWNENSSEEELKSILAWIDSFIINFDLEGYPLLKAYIYLEAFCQFVSLGLCVKYESIANSLADAYNNYLLYCESQKKYERERVILPQLIEEFQNSLYRRLHFRDANFSYKEASRFIYNERIRKIFDNEEDLFEFEILYRRKKW
ncbi:MAG: hypothetical protein WC472_00795 [Candidatus Paceibacterota bacterium]